LRRIRACSSRRAERMATVWFVNHYAGDPRQAKSGTRHHNLAVHLVRRGWNVGIIAASTEHPSGVQMAGMGGLSRSETVDGVDYVWLRSATYANNGLRRILNMLLFSALALSPRVLRGLPRPDVIVGSTVHPLAAWSASRLAKRRGVPFVFEVRDLWPETLIQMGALSRTHVMAKLLLRLEAHLCRVSSAIVTTMPLAVDYYGARGVARSKVHWISNGVEPALFDPAPASAGPAFTFTYFGSLGKANGLAMLIDAFSRARRMTDKPIRLRLVGSGAELPLLQARVAELNLTDQVALEPPVAKADIPRLAADADALIACLLPLPLYDYGISLNKIFEYLAAARPVVFAGSAQGNPMAAAGGVELCEPTADATARAMARVASLSTAEAARWGSTNRSYVEANFSYQSLADRYSVVLDQQTAVPDGSA
jgi:glycosyltransferase involved in cell wall biosynthesis